MRRIITWFDVHGLFWLSLFLLIFIPLYPKLPLFEAIPGYLVRVRVEDVLVGVAGLVWFVQLLRRKARISWPATLLMLGYATIGLLSLVVAIFLQHTIPLQLLHIGKSGLHFFRYLEYFSLFFFAYSGIQTKKQVQIALAGLVVCVAVIVIYGFGQKYLEWPVYSTMNREFSKGTALTLTANARIHSTFGGHYDLAAYLVLLLPLLFSIVIFVPNKIIKSIVGSIAAGGVALLIASAAKTALLGFIASAAIIWFQLLVPRLGWLKTIGISMATGATGLVLLGFIVFAVGGTYQQKIMRLVGGGNETILVSADTGEQWSENTKKYGLSMGIRLDTLWPQALLGFSINPWTGKGYATLNKLGISEFTEADSTDNNYLRIFGETGILGFMFFAGIVLYVSKQIWSIKPTTLEGKIVKFSFGASLVGLLINALIIDVFAASKVAFSFWGFLGLTFAGTQLGQQKAVAQEQSATLKRWWNTVKANWPLFIGLLVFILVVHKRPFSEYSPIQGFSFNQSAAKNVGIARCFVHYSNECFEQLSSQPPLSVVYVFYLIPWYLVLNNPSMYYFANLSAALVGCYWLYRSLKLAGLPQAIQVAALLLISLILGKWQLVSSATSFSLYFALGMSIVLLLVRKSKPKMKTWELPLPWITTLLLGSVVLLGISGDWLLPTIQKSYRDQYDAHHYRAVRRFNTFAQGWSDLDPQPAFVTNLDPSFIELYNSKQYSVLPVAKSYQQNLESGMKLFYSNAPNMVQDYANLSQTLSMADSFGMKLLTLDCEQRCNLFELFLDSPAVATKAATANSRQFETQKSYRLTFLPNQLSPLFDTTKYGPAVTKTYRTLLANQNPDGVIVTGTSDTKTEVDHGPGFRRDFIDASTLPVIYNISNTMPSIYSGYGPSYQRFTLGNTLLLFLDDDAQGRSADQTVFFFDTLLNLYQHPEIQQVVIISRSLRWAEALKPEDWNVLNQYANTLSVSKWLIIETAQSTVPIQAQNQLEAIFKDNVSFANLQNQQDPVDSLWTLTVDDDQLVLESYSIKEQVSTEKLRISNGLE